MTYRDDRDGLLAQAEALRAENERLQAENERLRKPAPVPPVPAPPKPRPPRGPLLGPARRRSLQRIGAWVAIAAAVILTIAGLVEACRRLMPSPEPYVLRVMALPDGKTVAVFLQLRTYGKTATTTYEIATFDIDGGGRRSLELSSDEYTLYPRVGDRAWGLRPDGKLELLDLSPPARQLGADALVAAVPTLAGGYRIESEIVNEHSMPRHAIRVELRDGSTGFVDMTPALHDRPSRVEPWRPGFHCGPDWGATASCERRECIVFAPVEGTTAVVLGASSTFDQGSWGKADRVAGPDATQLIRPGLVKLLESACAFELDGAVLAVHDSAALEPIEAMISLLDREGRARWTVPLSELTDRRKAEPLGATLVDGEIRLFLSEKKKTLDLVRLSPDGAVVAKQRLL